MNQERVECQSPGKEVTVELYTNEHKALNYNVTFNDVIVIEPSELGITVDGISLGTDVEIGSPIHSVINESYTHRGNHPMVRNHYNLWKFPISHKGSGIEYVLEFRVYDDGAAYRYIIPGDDVQHVDRESSSWKVMPNSKVWYFERLTPGWKLKSYAGEWLSTSIESLDTISPVGPIQGTPIVLQLPNEKGYAAITKAALFNYSGMRLKAVGDRTLVADFTEGDSGFDVSGTITTPWRAIMLADDLNELVNCDLAANLCPTPDPNLFSKIDYIKPGRSPWRWATLNTGTPDEERQFVDYAAELGFEYYTVDDGWNEVNHPFSAKKKGFPGWKTPFLSLKELSDYASEKGVGIWVWAHSKYLTDPSNDYQSMAQFFDKIKEAGAVGLKIDFMNGESKVLIDFEIAALRLAAERELMVNFHGCHAPTGESRTYPNEMTREGIRGLELNNMREGPLTAAHNAALPFTRYLVGHGDYTPLGYSTPGATTWSHQLATAVAFLSPLQIYCEHPEMLLRDPRVMDALKVIKAIPSVWDETIVLKGSDIGKLAALARRSGQQWFVSVLNGEGKQSHTLDLSFLESGNYEATLVRDDLLAERVPLKGLNLKANLTKSDSAIPFAVEEVLVSPSDPLSIEMAKSGGFTLLINL